MAWEFQEEDYPIKIAVRGIEEKRGRKIIENKVIRS